VLIATADPTPPQPRETRLAPRGELCIDSIDHLRTGLRDAAQRGVDVVVDLAEVSLLSAAAIGALVAVEGIRVVNPNPLARSVLEAVGLEGLIRE
jgi:anti-anti-sigma regulatory factor